MDKKGSIRISGELRQWLDKTQLDERVSTGREPSYAELMDRIFASSGGILQVPIPKQVKEVGVFRCEPGNHDLHRKLEDILTSGDEETIEAVVPNINIFHNRLQPKAKRPGKQRRESGAP
jgi:hypothetical protein